MAFLAILVSGVLVPVGPTAALPGGPLPAATLAPVEVPAADVLDVNFRGGRPNELAQGRTPVVKGEPVYGGDPDVGPIASFDGVDDGLAYPIADAWDSDNTPNVTENLTLQCVLRADTTATGGNVCGGTQSGGIAVALSEGTLRGMVHVDGSYRVLRAPLTVGTWHDVVLSYDGSALRLYVDGTLITEQARTGPVGVPLANARYLTIGGDAGANGNVEVPSQSSVAVARIWGQALTEAQVEALHVHGTEAPEAGDEDEVPDADVLDVSFLGGQPTDIAQGRVPVVKGAPAYRSDEKAGPVAAFDGVRDGLAYPIADAWDGGKTPNLTQNLTLQCYFRADEAATGRNVCGGQQGGGLAVGLRGATLTGAVHLGGGYRTLTAPLTVGAWHDVVLTYDGAALRLYVDGALAAEQAHTGPVGVPLANARYLTLGGDAGANGNVEIPSPSTIAVARMWGQALSATQVAALHARGTSLAPVPTPDVLDVDIAAGSYADRAQGRTPVILGEPVVGRDGALKRNVASFDGTAQVHYPVPDAWDSASPTHLAHGLSMQCTFRYDGAITDPAKGVCSGQQSGGLAVNVQGSELTASMHIGGGYKVLRAPLAAHRWYDVVATYDGTFMHLYVDGVRVASQALSGLVGAPLPDAHFFGLGADTGTKGKIELPGRSTVAVARLWSRALTGPEVFALGHDTVPSRDPGITLDSVVPAAAERLAAPVAFRVAIENQDAAVGWRYALDGEPIRPGQRIGEGLRAGAHTIEITATDLFGRPISWTHEFTSKAIPRTRGSDTRQGGGRVTLSAIAESTDGGDVTTTFTQTPVSVADGGFQGTVAVLPATLDFPYDDAETITGQQAEDEDFSASVTARGRIPFQRYDVEVPDPDADVAPRIRWGGVADPAREVSVRVWDTDAQEWAVIATSRGQAVGSTLLEGQPPSAAVDDGVVHVLVAATDPFADDLAPRDASAGTSANRDRFEDPEDYDFSFVHWSDPQNIAQAAVGEAGKWPGSVAYPTKSDVQTLEEQAIWAKAYTDVLDWTAANAKRRKISYFGLAGDIVNDVWAPDPDEKDEQGNLLYPGLREAGEKQNAFAKSAIERLQDAGIPTQLIAGNHDNRLGTETGPESAFSQTFSPDVFYDQAATWPEGASFHTWDETTDAEGNVVGRGKDSQNNYVLFTAGGLDFVAVGLSYGVTREEAEWADSVLKRYKDRNAILMTHSYLGTSRDPDGRGAGFAADDLAGLGLGVVADGERLWNKVVAANPNVFLVLAGHVHGVGTNLKTIQGPQIQHRVVELLADYQDYSAPASQVFTEDTCPTCVTVSTPDANGNTGIDVDGDGIVDHGLSDRLVFGASFLRLLQFDTNASTMSVDTYSPFFEDFGATDFQTTHPYNGAEDNFTVPVDLSTRSTSFATDGLALTSPGVTVIGTATARSGWPATVTWEGLVEGETYAWTATSQDAAGDDRGSTEQFGGVFVAKVSGSDQTAPTLHVPEQTTVRQGDAFDPLDGVTATDDADGDVTAQIHVVGSVDTSAPGVYTLLYSASDSTGNVTQVQRTVRVVATAVPVLTPTTVEAEQVAADFGTSATLSATVSPSSARGTVQFRLGENALCEARVVDGAAMCTVDILPPPGAHPVIASYSGDERHAPSATALVLTVRPPIVEQAPTSLTVRGARVAYGKAASVTVTVGGGTTTPGGSVQLRAGGALLGTGRVVNGQATIRLRAKSLKPGRHRVRVVYAGDGAHAGSTATVTVRVLKAVSRVRFSVPKKVAMASRVRVRIAVATSGPVRATGKVRIRAAGRKPRLVTVRNGRATVRLGAFRAPGRKRITITYLGDRQVRESVETKHVRVIRR